MRYTVSKYQSIDHLDYDKTWLMLLVKTNKQLCRIYPMIKKYPLFIPMCKQPQKRNNDKIIKYTAILPDYVFVGFDSNYKADAACLEDQIQEKFPFIRFLRTPDEDDFLVADKEFLRKIEKEMDKSKKTKTKSLKVGESFIISNGHMAGKTAIVKDICKEYIGVIVSELICGEMKQTYIKIKYMGAFHG